MKFSCILPSLGFLFLLVAATPRAEERSGGAATGFADTSRIALEPIGRPEKSQLVAHGLAVAGTAIPLLLLYAPPKSLEGIQMLGGISLVAGPSLGQIYAGSQGTALAGSLIRVLGGVLIAASSAVGCLGSASEDCGGDGSLGRTILYAGIAYSFFETKFAVDRANERARDRAQKAASRTSFTPTLFSLGHGRLAPGLAFTASF